MRVELKYAFSAEFTLDKSPHEEDQRLHCDSAAHASSAGTNLQLEVLYLCAIRRLDSKSSSVCLHFFCGYIIFLVSSPCLSLLCPHPCLSLDMRCGSVQFLPSPKTLRVYCEHSVSSR